MRYGRGWEVDLVKRALLADVPGKGGNERTVIGRQRAVLTL